MELTTILTIVFGILAAFFAVYWNKAKDLLKAVKSLLQVISDAIADDTLTKEEKEAIKQAIQDIVNIFKKETVKEAEKTIKNLERKKK